MDDSNVSLPLFNQIPPDKLESISISAYEVEGILKTLKTGKAAGPDSIDNRLLKEFARPLSAPLTDLFNFSLSTGKQAKFQVSGNKLILLLYSKRMTLQMYPTIDPYLFLILLVKLFKKLFTNIFIIS